MITRILFIALAMLGLTLSPDAYALKLEGFNIKQVVAGNDYPAIRVKFNHSTDNWTDVTSDMVEVKIEYRVDVKSAYALANSEISISLDNMYAEEGLHSSNSNYSELHIGTLRLRKPGNQLEEIKDTALDICNQIRGNGGKPNKEHRITRTFTASGHIDAYNTGPFFTEEMADDDKLMRVDVICEKDPTWHGPIQPKDIGLGAAAPDFKVIKLDLFLTTFANQYTTPSAGTRCQKLQVKLRIETSKEGQLSYTLWRQPGEKIHKVKFVSFQDSGPFKGRFVHEEVLWETFDKTTFQQYMLETPGIPVGMSTPWKEKHIICKGPGPGGLTTGPGPGGSPGSELPAFRVIDANVMLQRLPGNACPARVKVTATYRANMKGAFEHHVGCTNGFSQGGTLQVTDPISATNFGVKRDYLIEVPQSGELTCSARPIKWGHELAVKKLLVQCAGPPPGIRAKPKP